MNPPKAVSLFAGIGGICMGFKQAGFQIVWANEKDPAACRTYRYNFGNDYLVEGDIRKIDKSSSSMKLLALAALRLASTLVPLW